MNSYSDLDTLKSSAYLNIVGVVDYDTQLRDLLVVASRQLDKHTSRFFYVLEATRYYDGDNKILFLPDDLLTITTLKTDDGGDGTFENTFASRDYHLYPFNQFPKTRIEINPDGDYSHFARGAQKGVEIVGSFGYGETETPYSDSGGTGTLVDATNTSLVLSEANLVAAGQTLLMGSEQLYVEAVVTTTATVKRGVNGTTAATQTAASISIYEYPGPITWATLVMTMRHWKRKDSAYQDIVGSPETGTVFMSKGIDPDVREVIKAYRRVGIV